jgi:hypothetical protein
VQMIFAARLSRDFITPDHVREMENWTGKAVLQALTKFDIEPLVGVHLVMRHMGNLIHLVAETPPRRG